MWNTDDLDINDVGHVVIKDPELKARLKQLMRDHEGHVLIDMNDTCQLDVTCPRPIPQPPPNGMCICVVRDLSKLINSRRPDSD